ncbi:MAG: hypothetical protein JO296_06845 [Pseudonocardiales bacterium]|nr:hypothetical protein [Pseudonocardiales bacterium]
MVSTDNVYRDDFPDACSAKLTMRADWDLSGAHAISAECDVAVIVDVLSSTTTLTVAADRGDAARAARCSYRRR